MLKFIRGRSQQTSSERTRLQRELFGFRKTVQHGFPNKPTSIAWDPILRVTAIGTSTGALKVYGKPGVEFYGHHNTSDKAITKLLFIPGKGRLVSLCDTNSLHLWEINGSAVEEVSAHLMEGKFKKVSCMSVGADKYMYIGTEGGNVFLLNVNTFEMNREPIYQDVIIQSVADNYKMNPGPIESIEEQPGNPDQILIGYSRGLMVIWNLKTNSATQVYKNKLQLESLCWDDSGNKFVSAHNDGSYKYWDTEISDQPLEEPTATYGPFPCKAIGKIYLKKSFLESQDDLIIFTGGMPRASYSDRHAVTVHRNIQKTVAFDFTSKIVDFVTIASADKRAGCEALLVLTEEEIVCVDLASDDWKMIPLPYLSSLHASAITCSTHVSDVSEKLWNEIIDSGNKQTEGIYSEREWPINGGNICDDPSSEYNVHYKDLLITGHEDGSVKFWNAGSVSMNLLYTFKTSIMFAPEDPMDDPFEHNADDEDSEWPPFKKVGCFDPFSDDPRLAIKKISFCPIAGTLTIGGAAGQVLVCKVNPDGVLDKELKVTVMNNVHDKGDSFVWKGHKRLTFRGAKPIGETDNCHVKVSLPPGYQPCAMVQMYPPAAITALALHSSWYLVAAGTSHGLALYDYYRQAPVFLKCTLNTNDLTAINEPPISRTKSFKKSLRESFRRIRKGRSVRQDKRTSSKSSGSLSSTPTSERERRRLGDHSSPSGTSGTLSPLDTKPIERAVEARPAEDALGSMIRCLYFAHSFVINTQHASHTLWAGTNNGTVYIFTMCIPPDSKRSEEKVSALLGKEIQLKHRAPVVNIVIIDASHKPLPEPFEVERGLCKPVDNTGAHNVIIGSEEQFKIFSLPSLKPICKLKLTATEGARIRRMGLSTFTIPQHTESCLLCLTNLGECLVLSVPELRRQITTAVIRKEDINGISSLAFTKYGEALFLHSSSEIQRITLSSTRKVMPKCSLLLAAQATCAAQSDKQQTDNKVPAIIASPPTVMHVITNGIPEEDEEEEEDEMEEADKKASSAEYSINKDISSDEMFKDISAITVDSVRDHFANLTTGSGSGNATAEETQQRHAAAQEKTTTYTLVTSTSGGGGGGDGAEATSITTTDMSSTTTTTSTVEIKYEVTTVKDGTTAAAAISAVNGKNNATAPPSDVVIVGTVAAAASGEGI